MSKLTLSLLGFLVLFCVTFGGCSQKGEGQSEKASVEQTTSKAVEAIKKYTKTPIEKAKESQNLGSDRINNMDKVLNSKSTFK